MPLWVAALIACLVGAGAGIAYAAWRGLQLWRGARRTIDVLRVGGDRVSDGLARLSASSARLSERPGALGAAATDLQRSVAVLRFVTDAASEARAGAEPATALLRRRGRSRARRRVEAPGTAGEA